MNDKILYVLNIDTIDLNLKYLRLLAVNKHLFKIAAHHEDRSVTVRDLSNDKHFVINTISLTKAPLELTVAARLKGLI